MAFSSTGTLALEQGISSPKHRQLSLEVVGGPEPWSHQWSRKGPGKVTFRQTQVSHASTFVVPPYSKTMRTGTNNWECQNCIFVKVMRVSFEPNADAYGTCRPGRESNHSRNKSESTLVVRSSGHRSVNRNCQSDEMQQSHCLGVFRNDV